MESKMIFDEKLLKVILPYFKASKVLYSTLIDHSLEPIKDFFRADFLSFLKHYGVETKFSPKSGQVFYLKNLICTYINLFGFKILFHTDSYIL